jgi:DNA polymerase I
MSAWFRCYGTMDKLLIIDTFNFLHRAYHALPKTLTDSSGEPTNAVYGVTSMVITVLNQVEPKYMIAALDSKETTFRVEEFTGYKAHRKPMDEDLAVQIPKVIEMLQAFGIHTVQVNGYEADDIIATAVEKFKDTLEIVVVSNDRDLWQLVGDSVTIMSPAKGNIVDWIGPNEAIARFGFTPDKIADYKGLRGDPSDNIPGVYGIGEKTATKLIKEFGSMETIYKHLDKVTPDSLRKKLEESYEQALMSKKLAQLIYDVPVEFDLQDCKYSYFNKLDVKVVLERYNFKSLIKRLGFEVSRDGKSQKQKSEVIENQLGLL